MTEKRRNEIYNRASLYAWEDEFDFPQNEIKMRAKAFRDGAFWADKTHPSPWISVKDDLPSFHSDLVENAIATKNVIVLLNDGRIRETQLLCGHWKEYDKKVTHWMRIPDLPKE